MDRPMVDCTHELYGLYLFLKETSDTWLPFEWDNFKFKVLKVRPFSCQHWSLQ